MPERRIETQTSRTAVWTCVARAASYIESDSHYRSDDHIALVLVPPYMKFLLRIAWIRRLLCRKIAPRGIYEYTIARTRYIDAAFREILSEGVDQVLIFGAGFDSRALRFQKEAADTRIFELDAPVTQESKLREYEKLGLSIPENEEFIPIDFDKESLPDKLQEAGFHKGAKSLFLLEGVLMYLQADSVDETFSVIEDFAGEGSEVVFDYLRAAVLQQAGQYYGEQAISGRVSQAGEQYSFGIEESEVESFLLKYGLQVRDHVNPEALERKYFTDASGQVVGRVNGTHCLVRAVKSRG